MDHNVLHVQTKKFPYCSLNMLCLFYFNVSRPLPQILFSSQVLLLSYCLLHHLVYFLHITHNKLWFCCCCCLFGFGLLISCLSHLLEGMFCEDRNMVLFTIIHQESTTMDLLSVIWGNMWFISNWQTNTWNQISYSYILFPSNYSFWSTFYIDYRQMEISSCMSQVPASKE